MSTPDPLKPLALVKRDEFRRVVLKVVQCVCPELNVPGVSPCTPEELAHWIAQVTLEDIEAVWAEAHKS